jgi:glutamate decarboxylase
MTKVIPLTNNINNTQSSLENFIAIVSRYYMSQFSQSSVGKELKRVMFSYVCCNIALRNAYPIIDEMEQVCINFLVEILHGNKECVGFQMSGSSEACVQAGRSLFHNWERWYSSVRQIYNRERRPNLVISVACHDCWKTFSKIFDVELRLVPLTNDFRLDIEKAREFFDDYTIGVIGIWGNTHAGKYDDIRRLNEVVGLHNKATRHKIKIHVDAASGGMFAPFVQPEIVADFRLSNVISINISSHKFGLIPPALGWLIFRGSENIADELNRKIEYAGGELTDNRITFSGSAMFLAAQYHLIKTLGKAGYAKKHQEALLVAEYLRDELNKTASIQLISQDFDLPVICYELTKGTMWSLKDLGLMLEQEFGWYLATYRMPWMEMDVQRIVVRNDFTLNMAKRFIVNLRYCINTLNSRPYFQHFFSTKSSYGKQPSFACERVSFPTFASSSRRMQKKQTKVKVQNIQECAIHSKPRKTMYTHYAPQNICWYNGRTIGKANR